MKKALKKKNSDSIVQAAMAESKKGPPPVHLWNPPFCGDLDMRIARDGTWFYLGTPIGRAPLVKLFSSIRRLSENKNTIPEKPIRIPNVLTKLNFSFFV